MSRVCSLCGNNGHNSRTCSEGAGASGSGGIMLFGVRVAEGIGSFRKSASMTNLAQYDDQPLLDSNSDLAAGYASDDVVHASAPNRERKRGVPWTEEEHKLFLIGLEKVGKGDWRGISRNFVKTRTPTQVASHAQKYFLRRSNHNRRRRRSSLFDITTDACMDSVMEDQIQQEIISQPLAHSNLKGFPAFQAPRSPVLLPVLPPSSKMAGLNLNNPPPNVDPLPPLSLKLSASESLLPPPPPSDQKPPPARHSSGFQGMSGSFNNTSNSSGDSIISVA
ncbi:transcription factor MYB1R1 [Rhododendron vialii]|uniref:transcription factor MYB1R1 n=1 Tax=Rhododendron vialii TaxID=182163 RepID=UPI00265F7BCD|nr:transcription factor MYB1R1 [Rhododendron vialii]